MPKPYEDAFGQTLLDCYHGGEDPEIIERDDGFVDTDFGPAVYFTQYEEWPAHYKEAMQHVAGRVLDIGCGAGRHSLHLQQQGFDVLGVDISPLAVEVCRLRGLKRAEVLSITQLTRRLGRFDTILMLGNNFGLFGSFKRARWLLRRFHNMTPSSARIIAATNDPYATQAPEHLAYHEFNRRRGRMAGQIRLRMRYKTLATPWFDYLMVSRPEMEEILRGTGWEVQQYIDSEGSTYIAIIGKAQHMRNYPA
jgi:SAM-dependent methyltransferase